MKKVIAFTLSIVLMSCSNGINNNDNNNHKIDNSKWLGRWEMSDKMDNSVIDITNVNSDSLEFTIEANYGGNTGSLEGKAKVNNSTAIYSNYEYDTCIVEFTLLNNTIISLTQNGSCGAGMGVYYEGKYRNSKFINKKDIPAEDLVSLEVLTEKENSIFKNLVENDYTFFVNSSHQSVEHDDLDNLNMKVISSGVAGLYTEMENIIMLDTLGRFCVAVIDDHKVLYFSNIEEFKNKLPKTIDNWRQRFVEYEVFYKSKK